MPLHRLPSSHLFAGTGTAVLFVTGHHAAGGTAPVVTLRITEPYRWVYAERCLGWLNGGHEHQHVRQDTDWTHQIPLRTPVPVPPPKRTVFPIRTPMPVRPLRCEAVCPTAGSSRFMALKPVGRPPWRPDTDGRPVYGAVRNRKRARTGGVVVGRFGCATGVRETSLHDIFKCPVDLQTLLISVRNRRFIGARRWHPALNLRLYI